MATVAMKQATTANIRKDQTLQNRQRKLAVRKSEVLVESHKREITIKDIYIRTLDDQKLKRVF